MSRPPALPVRAVANDVGAGSSPRWPWRRRWAPASSSERTTVSAVPKARTGVE